MTSAWDYAGGVLYVRGVCSHEVFEGFREIVVMSDNALVSNCVFVYAPDAAPVPPEGFERFPNFWSPPLPIHVTGDHVGGQSIVIDCVFQNP